MLGALENVLVYITDSGEGFVVLNFHLFFSILQLKLKTFDFPGMEFVMRNYKMQ